MLVTKERYVFIVQTSFKERAFQVQVQFRFVLLQSPPPSKTAIQKYVLKYQEDDTCLNLNKTRQ